VLSILEVLFGLLQSSGKSHYLCVPYFPHCDSFLRELTPVTPGPDIHFLYPPLPSVVPRHPEVLVLIAPYPLVFLVPNVDPVT
jgi:hypothetical protein